MARPVSMCLSPPGDDTFLAWFSRGGLPVDRSERGGLTPLRRGALGAERLRSHDRRDHLRPTTQASAWDTPSPRPGSRQRRSHGERAHPHYHSREDTPRPWRGGVLRVARCCPRRRFASGDRDPAQAALAVATGGQERSARNCCASSRARRTVAWLRCSGERPRGSCPPPDCRRWIACALAPVSTQEGG
jgi:hypothetical protein